jgi:autotransporter-associated beta strand protein
LTLSGTNTGTNILAATLGNNGTGATSLVKSGPGTWVLSGENTFNGSTVITGGTLTLDNSLALGGSTLNYNNQGGLVDFGTLFSITLGGLAGAQNLPLTSAPALTIGGNGQDTTYSGSLTGANGLTKAGSGRLILSGANELAGTVTVSGGTLEVPTGGTLVTPGNISVTATGALFHQTGGVVTAAQLDLDNGSNSTRANATFDGGTATFTSTALSNGATSAPTVLTVNGGAVALGTYTSSRDGTNGFNTTAGLIINNGAVTAQSVVAGTVSWSNITVNNGSFTVDPTGSFVLGGGAEDRGGGLSMLGGTLTHLGTAGLVLNQNTGTSNGLTRATFGGGTSTLSGITLNDATAVVGRSVVNFNGGTVYLGSVGLQGKLTSSTDSVTVNLNGGTLGATASWTGAPNMTLAANGVTFQAGDAANSPHDISLVGLLTGNGTLTKTGAGKLTLGGANNTYTGATVVNSGMLLLSGAISGTTSVTVNNASLQLGRADAINDAAGVTLGAATFQTGGFSESVGALTLALASTLDLGAGASVLRFLDSSTATWNGTLSITNWSGSTSGGGTDQLFFGTTASGLSASQLSAVQFVDPNGISGVFSATMLSSGEVIAAVPEPGAFLSLLTGGGLLLGFRRRRAARD